MYSPTILKEAIEAAQATTAPIRLIAANGTEVQTYSVDYHDGIRYPHLERTRADRITLTRFSIR